MSQNSWGNARCFTFVPFGTHSDVELFRSFTAGLLDMGASYIVKKDGLTTSDRGQNSPPSRR